MVDRYRFLSKFCSFLGHCELKQNEKHGYKGMRSAKSNFINNIFYIICKKHEAQPLYHSLNAIVPQPKNCPIGVKTTTDPKKHYNYL